MTISVPDKTEIIMTLSNQRILIIGGTSGMGLAAAARLANQGAEVIISGRDLDRTKSAASELSGVVAGAAIDMMDKTSLARAADQIGRLDHLVLAASTGVAWGPFADVTPEALSLALEGKLLGYWRALQTFLPILRKDGSVVMLTGAASRTAMPGTAGLAAVNGAITQAAQTLARELAPLRVNVISPGLIDTPAYDGMPAEAKAGLFAQTAKALPVGRTGQPDDVAGAVELLLSNPFITGALIDVDGGARMSR